ncbi:hypothetical protein BC828DRAFT_380455 [Blastocladiella britannica]|nr:hypothetical protein BC828DRAFT_380455 [Blastocladiella britannica]
MSSTAGAQTYSSKASRRRTSSREDPNASSTSNSSSPHVTVSDSVGPPAKRMRMSTTTTPAVVDSDPMQVDAPEPAGMTAPVGDDAFAFAAVVEKLVPMVRTRYSNKKRASDASKVTAEPSSSSDLTPSRGEKEEAPAAEPRRKSNRSTIAAEKDAPPAPAPVSNKGKKSRKAQTRASAGLSSSGADGTLDVVPVNGATAAAAAPTAGQAAAEADSLSDLSDLDDDEDPVPEPPKVAGESHASERRSQPSRSAKSRGSLASVPPGQTQGPTVYTLLSSRPSRSAALAAKSQTSHSTAKRDDVDYIDLDATVKISKKNGGSNRSKSRRKIPEGDAGLVQQLKEAHARIAELETQVGAGVQAPTTTTISVAATSTTTNGDGDDHGNDKDQGTLAAEAGAAASAADAVAAAVAAPLSPSARATFNMEIRCLTDENTELKATLERSRTHERHLEQTVHHLRDQLEGNHRAVQAKTADMKQMAADLAAAQQAAAQWQARAEELDTRLSEAELQYSRAVGARASGSYDLDFAPPKIEGHLNDIVRQVNALVLELPRPSSNAALLAAVRPWLVRGIIGVGDPAAVRAHPRMAGLDETVAPYATLDEMAQGPDATTNGTELDLSKVARKEAMYMLRAGLLQTMVAQMATGDPIDETLDDVQRLIARALGISNGKLVKGDPDMANVVVAYHSLVKEVHVAVCTKLAVTADVVAAAMTPPGSEADNALEATSSAQAVATATTALFERLDAPAWTPLMTRAVDAARTCIARTGVLAAPDTMVPLLARLAANVALLLHLTPAVNPDFVLHFFSQGATVNASVMIEDVYLDMSDEDLDMESADVRVLATYTPLVVRNTWKPLTAAATAHHHHHHGPDQAAAAAQEQEAPTCKARGLLLYLPKSRQDGPPAALQSDSSDDEMDVVAGQQQPQNGGEDAREEDSDSDLEGVMMPPAASSLLSLSFAT